MPVPSSVFLHINARTLLIVLLLTLTPLVVDLVLVVDRSRMELTEVTGGYLETLSRTAAADVARSVEARATDVRLLARQEEFQRVTREANRVYARRNEPRVLAEYEEIDRNWESPQAASMVSKLVGSPASFSLREYLALNDSIARLVVTDQAGAAVAASHKPLFYYAGDQAWWINSFGDGRTGAVHLTDAHWDPVSRTDCIAISVPMLDADSKRITGVMRAFVEAGELGSILANAEPGSTGRALVVRDDGGVVSSRDQVRGVREKIEEIETLQGLLEQSASGYSLVPLRGGGDALVGFADVGLTKLYPDIHWTVLVAQDWAETSAPIESVNLRALISGLLAILLVGAVAVYFTTHRPAKFDPLEELHESQTPGDHGVDKESEIA